LPVSTERGYVIPAWGDQYVACAHHLRDSILEWHPGANVMILTDLPQGDQGGWANDWQVFELSPYRETIKLEADMWCAGPIDHWWTLFENRDVVISQGARNFYDQPAQSRFYRRVFDDNNLPDIYNAITYWRRSATAQEFFSIVRDIFQSWPDYQRLLKFPEAQPSTDVVYAMAAQIMGVERVTLPPGLGPTIVHMKQHMIGTRTPDWTRELIWEFTRPGLRINTVAQWGLVHYHIKDWLEP
jgi:hypothetical protein